VLHFGFARTGELDSGHPSLGEFVQGVQGLVGGQAGLSAIRWKRQVVLAG
jgi:hypothetical protein